MSNPADCVSTLSVKTGKIWGNGQFLERTSYKVLLNSDGLSDNFSHAKRVDPLLEMLEYNVGESNILVVVSNNPVNYRRHFVGCVVHSRPSQHCECTGTKETFDKCVDNHEFAEFTFWIYNLRFDPTHLALKTRQKFDTLYFQDITVCLEMNAHTHILEAVIKTSLLYLDQFGDSASKGANSGGLRGGCQERHHLW